MSHFEFHPTTAKTVEELVQYLNSELRSFYQAIAETEVLDLREAHSEPHKPRDGMIVYADGTDWDPGSGRGLYVYNGGWTRGNVANGSNANGAFTVFADGTLICTKHDATFSFADTSTLSFTWTFPLAFVNTNYAVSAATSAVTADRTNVPRGSERALEWASAATTSVILRWRDVDNAPFVATSEVRNCRVMAVGRWA